MEIFYWILLVVIVAGIFYGVNRLAFGYSGRHFKKRLWAGLLFIFSTPLFMFGLSMGVRLIEDNGWLAGSIGFITAIFYFLNGLFVFISAFRLVNPSELFGKEDAVE
ncbi:MULTISPECIES: hypothetical protein [Pontibacillus]|uniref:Uncharacterized protein n=1 Tax=Pontibacillus chungwhensis TaxID=265426 RepID=A0ABY8V3L5_9BACI|nr:MULTISPECIES: hypothetical protein [Pontibacillus]MCD5324501.1 hypothetical protein [Pontibacillus sp. HN14]WIF99205.1 hypothetical protein QNI29_05975 [Pontibacillus chungwhensis]